MAEAALSAFIDNLVGGLISTTLEQFGLLRGVNEELHKLKTTLVAIQDVLEDADKKQVTSNAVRNWLQKLKDVAYEADDILDEVATEALRLKVEGSHTRKRKQVQNFILSFFSSRYDSFERNVANKIKEVRERLDEIAKERHDLHLREGDGGKMHKAIERAETSSLIDESVVFGREDDKEKIIELLLLKEVEAEKTCVIPIVGMGGIGKTTLAQLVYNDGRIEKHFELRAWASVSENFDARRLIKAITESATKSSCELLALDPMQRMLQDLLSSNIFLIVLDDMWSENRDDWDELSAPFKYGAKGSKVIVTTRSKTVSSIVGTIPAYCLECLSEDDCWLLFKRRTSEGECLESHPNLKPIGMNIVRKCKGLPLAVKTLAGLIHSTTDENKWDNLLKSEIWDLPDDKNGILPALKLSYHLLPSHLKQCFEFCSIFPKSYEFRKDVFVQLWMAEGYVQPKGKKKMEDIGGEYFDDFILKSFFQYSRDSLSGGKPIYIMHDLLHDLAQSVSDGECFRVEEGKVCSTIPKKIRVIRHSSLVRRDTGPVDFEYLNEMVSLRTFVILYGLGTGIDQKVQNDLFLNLKCLRLRVLDLSFTDITELSDSIGNLKHLRYLDLSFSLIERLPESMTSLFNLQTLKLSNCYKLLELPKDTRNLISLRHLIVDNYRLVSFPPNIGRLTNLQTLSEFVAGKENGCGIGELKELVNLQGTFCISKLETVMDPEEAKEVDMKRKQNILKLELKWEYSNIGSRAAGTEEAVLKGLQPHTNLKELMIHGYVGDRFPTWMGDPSFSNLVKVSLFKSKCLILPPLGQLPFLNYLDVDGFHGVKHVGNEFCGVAPVRRFPSIRSLFLVDMSDLEEWSGVEEGDMPRLDELFIYFCPNFRVFSLNLLTLKNLTISHCESLTALPRFRFIHSLTLSLCHETILTSVPYLTSLSSLSLSDFPNVTLFPEWLLRPLIALEELAIVDFDDLVFFHKNALRNLARLKYLRILSCSKLKCLPDEGLPMMLTSLEIVSCPSLKCLPKLPTSLQCLSITSCPILKERCQRDGGADWNKMSHVPDAKVD